MAENFNSMRNSIYIHIPFCRERCSYCAFNTFTDRQALIADYVDAVCQELQSVGQSGTGQCLGVHTIYFGGGTPSLLSSKEVAKIITAVSHEFNLTEDVEISLEANPGTVDAHYFESLVAAGVTRLSLGVQSAHQQELDLFGRLHNWPDVEEAVAATRMAGFANISLDLIYGVPNQTLAMWETSLDRILALEPEHLSLYALGLESGTEMTRAVKYGELPAPNGDLAADMYDLATEKLDAAGFIQYEISNWGRPGTFCQHNIQYWRNLPYFGIGAGAHGYVQQTRTVNAMRPEDYIERLSNPSPQFPYPASPATIKAETIDPQTDQFETIFMGLRLLHEGLSLDAYTQRYGIRLEDQFAEQINELTAYGLLERKENHLFLTRKARLISNQVFNRFLDMAEV